MRQHAPKLNKFNPAIVGASEATNLGLVIVGAATNLRLVAAPGNNMFLMKFNILTGEHIE